MASEEFWNAVISAGTAIVTCEFCQREHFAGEPWPVEPGEIFPTYEEMCAKAEAEPDKYVQQEGSSASWGYIDGKQAPYACPCSGADKYEEWILRHRYLILNFLSNRAYKLMRDAENEVQAVQRASDRCSDATE